VLLLTVADIRAVGPAVWNGWKGQLLRELYHRTEEALSGGASTERAVERVLAAQKALRSCLLDWSDETFTAYLERGQSSYWLSTDIETLARHAELVRRTDDSGKRLALDFRSDAFHAVTEVTIYTPDHHGLFALIAGAMAVLGVNIVEAMIFTTNDGMALDTFWIQDAAGGPLDDARALAKLETTIENTLTGAVEPGRDLARQVGILSRTRVFEVTPRVVIDNTASHVFTVIEVNARDRRGLLYDVTQELAELGLSIATARVATYGESAVDVFYVKDVFGLKVTHDGKLDRIRTDLMTAIAKSAGMAASATNSNDLRSTVAAV
jgi:[protein-PII] uridylyltransferase